MGFLFIVIFVSALIFMYLHTIYLTNKLSLLIMFIAGIGFTLIYLMYPNLILITISHAVLNFTVVLYSAEKKKVFRKLEKLYGKKHAPIIVHSVKLYYALKDYIETCPSFYICCDGFSPGQLKHHLKRFLNTKYHEKKINIIPSLNSLFGKKNIADRLAWNVNKKGKTPTKVLTEKHFKMLDLL